MVSNIVLDTSTGQFPKEVPFVLYQTEAGVRWDQTISMINFKLKTDIPKPMGKLIIPILVPAIIGLFLLAIEFAVFNNLILGLIGFMICFTLSLVPVPFYIYKTYQVVNSIQSYLREENETFYNHNGINLSYRPGSEEQTTNIEIEMRVGGVVPQQQQTMMYPNPESSYHNYIGLPNSYIVK